MSRVPRTIFFIIGGAFLLRLALLGLAMGFLGEQSLLVSDAPRFLKIAEALVAGHGFTLGDPPYDPSAFFPPLFFLLLGGSLAVSGSILPLLLVHVALGAVVIPFLVWKISGFLTERQGVRYGVVALAAFEPQMLLWSMVPTTEVVAATTFLAAFYFFLQFLHESRWPPVVFAGFFLGLSTLTRPHGQFLFLGATVFLLTLVLLRKVRLRLAVLFVISFLLILSPWLVRNYIEFQKVSVATTGLRNIYSDFAASVVTLSERGQFGAVRQRLYEEVAKKHHVSVREIREDPRWGRVMAHEGFRIITAHPKESGEVFAIALGAFLSQDLYTFYLEHFELIPPVSFDFSPSVVLWKEGPFVLVRLIWQKLGVYAAIPVFARVFWILLVASAVGGVIWAFRQGGRKKMTACLMAMVILYYALTSSIGAFSDQGRLRYPVSPLIFILGSIGAYQLTRVRSARIVSPQAPMLYGHRM